MKNTRTHTALADELATAARLPHRSTTLHLRRREWGKSGLISVTHCGQEILTRTACEVNEKEITARFAVGFPANGRTINARELEKILFTYLPECVKQFVFIIRISMPADPGCRGTGGKPQQAVRDQLKEQGLVPFVADDAVSNIKVGPPPPDRTVCCTLPLRNPFR